MASFRTLVLCSSLLLSSLYGIGGTTPQLRSYSNSQMEVVSKQKYIPGEVLVRFRESAAASARKRLHQTMRASVTERFEAEPNLELVRVPEGTSVQEAVRQYRADSNVIYAEPNFVVHALETTNDPAFLSQWHLSNTAQLGGGIPGADIHAPQAWQVTTGNKNVVVVTLDSGIDYTHQDLVANVFSNSADCNSNLVDDDGDGYADDCHGIDTVAHTSDPMDDNGHGTHVAGLIGAVGNNSVGVSGVNWNVQLVACKFLDRSGNGSVAGAVECLNYAKTLKQRGVNVIATNNSWGGIEFSQALADAIDAQSKAGILFIASAGNDFGNNDVNPVYPATISLPNVISVAATTDSDRLALFSNVGAHTVHLGAPGQELLSTLPGSEYGLLSGSSMAAPLVTGVAALLAASDPNLTWKEIKNRILSGGDPLTELSNTTVTGRRLNAYGALTCTDAPILKRLRPVQHSVAGAVGTPITISYLNINCAQQGSAIAAQTSSGDNIALKDDGAAPDLAANDGVFTGSWTPVETGSYSISLPDGDSLAVQVLTAYRPVQELAGYREIGGVSLNLSDDSVGHFTSPFPIRYGDGRFTDVFVSSDGTISFTDPFQSFYNRVLPLLADDVVSRLWDSSAVTLLAPYWDDLYPIRDSDQNVFWVVSGTAPNRELVIEWRNVRLFDCRNDADKTIAFEVVLPENDSNVYFLYKNVQSGCALSYNRHDFGGSATVGLQVSSSKGSTWFFGDGASHSGVVANGMALRWQLVTVPIPDNPAPTISKLDPNEAPSDSKDTTITITGTNFIPGSHADWDPNDSFSVRLRTTYVSSTQLTATIPAVQLQSALSGRHQISVFNPTPGGGQSNALPFGVGVTPAWVTSLSPSSVVAGAPAFTITINGMGFGDGSSGRWVGGYFNGAPRTTRWISPTQVQMDVSALDIAKAGTAKIYVYVNAWGTTNSVDFPITTATGSASSIVKFQNGIAEPGAPQKPYRFLGWGQAAAQNGDEYIKRFSRQYAGPNLAPATSAMATGASSLQNGLPSLPPGTPLPGIALRPTLPTGYIPTSVAIADFNRDGKKDWAITNGGDNSAWIYIGRGDGTWDPPHIIRLRGAAPVAIIAADLRGYGTVDLLVAETDSGTLGVLRGRGDGTFEDENEFFLPAPPTYLCSGDFNNDGKQDVLVGTLGTVKEGALFLLKGDGTGSLGAPVWLPNHKRFSLTTPSATWLATGDWNKDGSLDVTASEPFPDPTSEAGLLAYVNRGDGSFKEGQEVWDNWFVMQYGVGSGDINEDGCEDLVMSIGGVVLPYLGHCDGSFTKGAEQWIGVGDFSYGVKLADVNGDGHLDLLAFGVYSGGGGGGYGNDSGTLLTVALGNGDGRFQRPHVYRGESSAVMFDVGDVNGDGKPDIITANQDSDSATIFLNTGNGEFGPPSGDYVGYLTDGDSGTINTPLSPPIAANITGHGTLDIGYIEAPRVYGTPYNVTVLPNLGGGKFGAPVRTPIGTGDFYLYDFLFGDFRNTGRSDLLLLRSGNDGGYMAYLFAPANADGTFGTPSVVQTTTSWGALGSGDFNGDGKLDFLIADVTTTGLRLSVYIGDGVGNFNPLPPTVLPGSFGTRPYSVYIGDVNKDNKPDVLVWLAYNVVPYTDHDVFEFLGNGDGTFATGRVVLQNVDNFRVADLNRDGLPDVVEFNNAMSSYPDIGTPKIRVYRGQPDGAFTLQNTYQPYTGAPRDPEQWRMVVVPPSSSRLADFDGDGELDIAAYEMPPYRSHGTYVQFLKGRGDGSFTPTYAVHRLESPFVPYISADFTGDGIADMFDLVAYSASWNLIPGRRGPELQLSLRSQPISGQQGTLRITMNAPSDQSVTLSLNSSDPAVIVPASVTVPIGTSTTDVPFQITGAFDSTHVFAINATTALQTYTVYGSQLLHGQSGFALATMNPAQTILPTQTLDYTISIVSKNGWRGTVTERCEGLPTGASCVVPESVAIGAGSSVGSGLKVTTTNSIAQGKYTFTFIATDGTNEARLELQLQVGDFGIQVSPDTSRVLPSGGATFNVNLPATQGFMGVVTLSCDGLPANVSCDSGFGIPGFPTQIGVQTKNQAPGNYAFKILGTNNGVTRSANATLRVVDITTSYSPTSGSIKVGQSFDSTVTVQAPNGFDEEVTLSCAAPLNVSCSLSTPKLTFSGTPDTKTVHVTLTANRLSANATQQQLNREHRELSFLFFALAPAAFLGTLFLGRRSAMRFVGGMMTLIALSAVLLSCGGGGGGTTNPPTPPAPPPTPPPTTNTVTVNLYLQSTSIYQRQIGSIELKISE